MIIYRLFGIHIDTLIISFTSSLEVNNNDLGVFFYGAYCILLFFLLMLEFVLL